MRLLEMLQEQNLSYWTKIRELKTELSNTKTELEATKAELTKYVKIPDERDQLLKQLNEVSK